MLNGMFRSAYELSKSLNCAPGSLYSRLGKPMSCYRRQAIDVFSAFLATLAYDGDIALRGLFSCSECEQVRSDGAIELKGVVLDGMATGILGALLSFECPAMLVEPAVNASKQQFLFALTRLRQFFDVLFQSVLSNASMKDLAMKPIDRRAADTIERCLFPRSESSRTAETKAIAELIFILFTAESVAVVVRGDRRRRTDLLSEASAAPSTSLLEADVVPIYGNGDSNSGLQRPDLCHLWKLSRLGAGAHEAKEAKVELEGVVVAHVEEEG